MSEAGSYLRLIDCVSLNSRLESNKEEEVGRTGKPDVAKCAGEGVGEAAHRGGGGGAATDWRAAAVEGNFLAKSS